MKTLFAVIVGLLLSPILPRGVGCTPSKSIQIGSNPCRSRLTEPCWRPGQAITP